MLLVGDADALRRPDAIQPELSNVKTLRPRSTGESDVEY